MNINYQYNAIHSYIVALFETEADIAKARDLAVQAYCSISDYEEMKALNKAFNEFYYAKAESLGKDITSKDIKDKCLASVQYIRKLAKSCGWQQPTNPNAGVRRIADKDKSVKFSSTKEVVDEEGNTSSMKLDVILSNETIIELVTAVTTAMPKTVYNLIFDKQGNLRKSLMNTIGGEALANETSEKLQSDIQAIIDKLTK